MKKLFLTLLIVLPLMMMAQEITTIAQIQENTSDYNGDEVTIEGVVTIGAGKLRDDRLQAYIQDESGKGIQVFDYDITNAYTRDFVRGTRLQMTGTIEEYNGTTEITDFTYEVISTGNLIPMTDLTYEEMNDYQTWEGAMTWFYGLITDSYSAGGGLNVTLEDTEGHELVFRLWDTCDVDPDIEVGDWIVGKGIVGFYNNAAQLLPAYEEDFTPFTTIIEPETIYAENEITVKLRVEWTEEVSSVQLRYALESDQLFHPVTMTPIEGVDRGFEGIVPPINTLTDQSDNYVFVYVGMDAAGSTIVQSGIIPIITYTGVPFIDSFEFYTDYTEDYNFIDYPFNDESITIRVKAVDDLGEIEEVYLQYGLETDTSLEHVLILDSDDNDWYEGDLPPVADYSELIVNYVFQIFARDDDNNVVNSEEIEIVIAPRAPLVYDMEFLNAPAPGDSLVLGVNIWDTDGMLTEQYIQYRLNYDSKNMSAELVRDTTYTDTTRYIGIIPAKSSGTTVFANVIAYDMNGYSTSDYPGNEELEVEYTYPVTSHKAILKIPPEPFNPYAGETIPIDFYSKQGDKALLRIYSSTGRLVHTAKNLIITDENGFNRYEWDGRNRARNILPLGLYIVHLEVTEVDTGHKKTAKAPIVIGAPLK